MKLSTIWTLPGMSFKERLRRTREWLAMYVAALVPLRIRYHVTLQEIGKATKDSWNIPATPLEDILRKLDRPKDMD